jgi:hypothetical protein
VVAKLRACGAALRSSCSGSFAAFGHRMN